VCATGLVAVSSPAAAAFTPPGHPGLVSATPQYETPNVQDESVDVIYDAGQKIIAGGGFTRVRSIGATKDDLRSYLFAFDEDTGVVDQSFAPVVDGVVTSIIAGPTPGTVFIGGRFSAIGVDDPATTADDRIKRNKIALLNVDDGSVVDSWKGPALNGAVMDMVLAGDRLIVGGSFTQAGGAAGPARLGLASLNATTGALDDYLTVGVAENHNWTEGSTGVAKAPVGVDKLALSPDGSKLVAIGNFKQANGATHDQIVKIDMGATEAALADWNTNRFQAACIKEKFDSWVRDVAFSPNGEFFVVATTGGGVDTASLCDTATRWDADATGTAVLPTWTAYTGGDTLLSVAISEKAVYVGGHMRWMNNQLATNSALGGAVARPGLAALDPESGMPLSWNPGRNPRGYGTTELYVTPQGLWAGYDQEYIGNQEFKHDRLAFFPLEGGKAVHSTATESLPSNVYTFGGYAPAPALLRINVGGDQIVATDGGPNWLADTAALPHRYHNAGLTARVYPTWIRAVQAPPIQPRTPREIFSSERTGNASVPNQDWNIPIAKGTKVVVRLYFANQVAGTRKFHINIDGFRKATNFDIVAKTGGAYYTGTMLTFPITSDGNIGIDLLRVSGYPLLNGIEIWRNPTPPLVGTENKTFKRSYDGNTTVGAKTEIPTTAFPWEGARGGFYVGGSVFFAHGTGFYRASFNGTTLGTPAVLNPYSDPKWDTVLTYSGPLGQTYKGMQPDFYYELPSIGGMFYDNGRLYYTIAGHAALYWRPFTPDTGTVGSVRTAVTSSINMAGTRGVFISDGKLYMVDWATGNLQRTDWVNGAPSGAPTVVSGPTINGQDWRAKVVFVGP
jgi:hypothetical protein